MNKLRDSTGRVLPKNAYIIRHTEIGSYLNCPRYWFLTSHNGLNLEPRVKDKKLRFGSAWHSGLEKRFKSNTSVMTGFQESWDKQVEELTQELGQGIYDETIQADLKDMLDLGIVLGEAYDEWVNTDATPKDSELKVIDVEKRLLVRIPRTYTWLAAKLDAIVEYAGAVWTMEHKTRARSSRVDNPGNVNRDIQMGLQLLALKLAGYTDDGKTLGGAIYNLARKQAPSSRVKNPIFARHMVYYTERQLYELMTDLQCVHSPAMREASRLPAVTLRRYNPGIGSNCFCDWGCHAQEVCEALNRYENVEYLVGTHFKSRNKNIRELIFDEMETEE